jgi:hypothetical protein
MFLWKPLLKFLLGMTHHAFSLVTFRHTGRGLPKQVSGSLIAALLVCSLFYAWHFSPEAGFVKLLVWSVASIFLPAISVATALLSTSLNVFADIVGMEKGVRDFWYFTAWILAVVRIWKG